MVGFLESPKSTMVKDDMKYMRAWKKTDNRRNTHTHTRAIDNNKKCQIINCIGFICLHKKNAGTCLTNFCSYGVALLLFLHHPCFSHELQIPFAHYLRKMPNNGFRYIRCEKHLAKSCQKNPKLGASSSRKISHEIVSQFILHIVPHR